MSFRPQIAPCIFSIHAIHGNRVAEESCCLDLWELLLNKDTSTPLRCAQYDKIGVIPIASFCHSDQRGGIFLMSFRPKIAPCIFGIHTIHGNNQKLLLHFWHT